MIRYAGGEWAALFEASVGKFGIFGTKIYSQYQTYGLSDGVLDLWLLLDGDRAVGAVSRLDGTVTLAADAAADADELAAFLAAVGCRSYEGERALCERVNAVIRGGFARRESCGGAGVPPRRTPAPPRPRPARTAFPRGLPRPPRTWEPSMRCSARPTRRSPRAPIMPRGSPRFPTSGGTVWRIFTY